MYKEVIALCDNKQPFFNFFFCLVYLHFHICVGDTSLCFSSLAFFDWGEGDYKQYFHRLSVVEKQVMMDLTGYFRDQKTSAFYLDIS